MSIFTAHSREKTGGLIIVGMFLLSVFSLDVLADTVILKNGRRITGVIAKEDKDTIVIETFYGAGILTESFDRDRIKDIVKDSKENEKILKQYVEDRKQADEKEQIRKEAEEEQKRVLEELDAKCQAEQEKQEMIKQRKREAEAEKKKKAAREKELETFNVKVDELKAVFEQKDIEDKAYRFGEITSYKKYDRPNGVTQYDSSYYKIYFQGLFYNDGTIAKKNVVVIMSFYDAQGNWLARRSIYTDPTDIPPGGSGSFELAISTKFAFATYELSAVWDY